MPKLLSAAPISLQSLRQVLEGASFALANFALPPGAMLPDEAALVLETSGSTAQPKRAVFSAAALEAAAAASLEMLGRGQWLLCLPKHYVAGVQVLLRSLLSDTVPVDIVSFSPESFVAGWRQLTSPRKFVSLVPAQLQALVAACADASPRDSAPGKPPALTPDEAVQCLRSFTAILCGGQSTPDSLVQRCQQLGVRLVRTYGSTETLGGCVYEGVPLPGVQLRLVDDRLLVHTPSLSMGYLTAPDAGHLAGPSETNPAVPAGYPLARRPDAAPAQYALDQSAFSTDADGRRWFHTQDRAQLRDGQLLVLGRADRVIISGGLKLDLDYLESRLRELPGVSEAAVLAAPDEKWGELALVFIEADPPGSLAARQLLDNSGPVARSAQLKILTPMPRLPSGKPDRSALQKLTAQDRRA